jgi:hypothetical protein
MQTESPLSYWDQNLAAGSNPDAPLELSPPRFESSAIFPQFLKATSGLKCGGLAGYHGNGTSKKNQEPQQHPVPALKPHRRAETFSV